MESPFSTTQTKFLKQMGLSVSTVVEVSTHYRKVEGLNTVAAGTRGLHYKTFYGRNLRIFVIS